MIPIERSMDELLPFGRPLQRGRQQSRGRVNKAEADILPKLAKQYDFYANLQKIRKDFVIGNALLSSHDPVLGVSNVSVRIPFVKCNF